ncbi:TonB-dependent siderophore receptor [Acinetobacter qingfengensis]|uniref:Ligand-gated channel protein n=1 Tax=Acinetobacter qingfengensis TaxID=1262585 RepID=A0A1E7REP7_9GAMM|nr:TonB-dependent siderophore receptor [Acinetobacter qingfengensis]KAA8734355.1 TonB-dependent siderophore receptor [Acinetobacter qingfengensis]OEY97635.1 ligand-gated channel protein [Acinetobacter qingfengensis]
MNFRQSYRYHALYTAMISCIICSHAYSEDHNIQQLPTLEVQANDSSQSSEQSQAYTVKKTSSATKLDIETKETPQTINIITQQQLQDFSINSIRDALSLTPGVTVSNEETDRSSYLARGFEISNILIDGVGFPLGSYNYNDLNQDTFIYDRIEVVKGADALTNAFGDPSATVNMIRKRPTKDFNASANISYGSWDTKRYEADISGSLTKSGNVRGRIMGYEQTGNSYLNNYSKEKNGLAAIIEADLTDSTLLTTGISQTRSYANAPNWGANPIYNTAGEQLSYSSSYNYSPDWSYKDHKVTNYFVNLEQKLGDNWKLKLGYDETKEKNKSSLLYLYGTPSSTDNTSGILLWPGNYAGEIKTRQANINLDGSYTLFGRQHEAMLGYTWSQYSYIQSEAAATNYLYTTDLASWTPSSLSEFSMGDFYEAANYKQTIHSIFAATRFHLNDDLKLILGGNFVNAKSEGTSYGTSVYYDVNKFSPYAGLTYNFTPEYTGYLSYTSIFRPQTSTNSQGKVNDPIDGDSYEIGIKSAWLNDRLTGTFAIFRTTESNYPLRTSDNPFNRIIDTTDMRSQGVEVGLTGKLNDNLNLSFGFTQFSLKDLKNGGAARTYNPTQTINLAATYTLDSLPQLKVGIAARYQNDIEQYFDGYGTVRQDAYALLDLMASYDINKHITIQANGYNVTNTKYLNSIAYGQSYYGAPANYTVALKFKY